MTPQRRFPRTYRLTRKAEFDWVFKSPNQRVSLGALQAIFKSPAKANGDPPVSEYSLTGRSLSSNPVHEAAAAEPLVAGGPRLGLVVAKRFVPLAVDRNALKRKVRERFRRVRADLPAVDVIVRLRSRPPAAVSAGDVAALFGKMQRLAAGTDASRVSASGTRAAIRANSTTHKGS